MTFDLKLVGTRRSFWTLPDVSTTPSPVIRMLRIPAAPPFADTE
jgi:hypothetical protein